MKKVSLVGAVLFIFLMILWFGLIQNNDEITLEKEASKQSADSIALKMGHNMPANSALHRASMRFAQEVEKKTEGKITITVYPEQQLGNDHQMIELARKGEIDILLTPTAKMSVYLPSMQYADLPFLFPSREDAYVLLDGKVGDMLLQALNDIDLFGVTFWENGFKNFTSNDAILKIEDLKNKKIRVMKSHIIMEQFHALNALPIAIDFAETKKALSDGVVDAQENPLVAIVGMEFYKVQSDITLSEHAYLAYVFSFSKKRISELPLKLQYVLMETAKELTAWERKASQEDEKKALEIIKSAGLKIHTLSPYERQRFEKATEHIKKKYEDTIGAHIISKTQEYMQKKYPLGNSVTIGIDADLSMGAKGSGLAIKRGAELAVEEINRKGGLLGKKVLLAAKDHLGISTQAAENIKEFIADKNVIALIGGKHSAIISSYLKTIQEQKMIFFSPWAAATMVTENGYKDNYVFRVSVNDRYATKFLAKEALKKSSNPAIVVENSLWGKEALKNINNYFVSKGLKKQEGFIISRGETDFEKVLRMVKNGSYDSIIMVLNSQEATKCVQSMGESQFYIPIISHWGMVGDSFFYANKKFLTEIDLSFIQTFSFANHSTKEALQLKKNYLKSYAKSSDEQINAVTGVVQAYDSVMLLAQAVEKSKSFDSLKIKEALEHLGSYQGVIKRYDRPFNQGRHDALNEEDFFMAKFDHNGNILPIRK